MNPLESNLAHFLEALEQAGTTRYKQHSEIVKFWQDSFNQYIGKMKRPKDITSNPRRFFHLHAMRYVLEQSNPNIVWNLCVGNVKTNIPVLERFIELSKEKKSKTYWINIDFVSELKFFNEKALVKYLSTPKKNFFRTIDCIEYDNTVIFNITGYVEDFFDFFNNNKYNFSPLRQTLLCLDGISNVTVQPADWSSWWMSVKKTLATNFTSWYFTFLHPNSLVKKFDFYYNVVLLKHKIPVKWLDTSILDFKLDKENNLSFTTKSSTFYELQENILSKIIAADELTTTDLLFRFFSDEKQTTLVYQALYITEPTLHLLSNVSLIEYVGHKEIDKLIFDLPDDFYESSDKNFVKSIPYIGLKDQKRIF